MSLKEAQKRFINKICNLLSHSRLFHSKDFNIEDLAYPFSIKYGLKYTGFTSIENTYLTSDLSFFEFIIRLNCLIDLIAEKNAGVLYTFINFIKESLNESPIDLQLRVKKNKKSYDILPSGSPLLDEKLVDNSLAIIEDSKYKKIRIAFEKGLKEFLVPGEDKSGYLNAIRDMQLSLDEVSKILLNDKNVGFKHLLKNKNWENTGLNEYFQKIFYQLNEMIDKLVKHNSSTHFSKSDTETIIYLTGMFIRLTCS